MPAYLFDVGNVILFFDFSIAVRRVADDCSIAEGEILPAITDLTVQLELGELGVEAFTVAAAERIGYRLDPLELVTALEDIFTVNEAMADTIDRLHADGHPLYLLSNTNAIHAPYFTTRYPLFEKFSGAIFSYEVRAMKPDAAIFDAAAERLGLEPSNTVYIDDLRDNVEAGATQGYRAIHYDCAAHEDFLREIEALAAKIA